MYNRNMKPVPTISRRDMLNQCSTGFGLMALAALTAEEVSANRTHPSTTFGPRVAGIPLRVRNVIFCFMSGGVSQVDSFDPKPRLDKEAGKPLPLQIERTQFNDNGTIMPSPWKFRNYGQSGIPVSDLFPHVGRCADDLAVIRSMTADFSEHAQANYFMHTGFSFMGHPSAGAWINYGLGSETRNLPGFVVLRSGGSGFPHGGRALFGSGFLPAVHQASVIDADSDQPMSNINPIVAKHIQRHRLDFIRRLDDNFLAGTHYNKQLESAIQNYELAFQMQAAVPELVDLRHETEATKRMYGVDASDARKSAYARQCLLARRLVERGVRFVELTCLQYGVGGGNKPNPWDQHEDLAKGHEKMAYQVDQPIAALIKDLKQRGLLDETLVIWAGEFGRTPFAQGAKGRDHDPYGFSIWLAGGGIRGGTVYGATDDFGYHVTEDAMTVYDLWATVLHLLGIHHKDLTYRHGGRDIRLTDVHGRVVDGILM